MAMPPLMRVTKQQAKALLAAGGWRHDPELTRASGDDSYRSTTGQALVFLPGRMGADICDDRDAMLAYCLAARAEPPKHILEGLFPYGETFPQEVPRLIAQLASDTGLALADLDRTVESLGQVERTFRRKGGARSFLTESRFPPVVAYVGEVLRNATKGEWKMELASGTWEPWIVGSDRRRFAPFGIAYEELERGRGGSLWGATHGRLWGHLLGGPPKGSN
jgi:hypothetical protein